MKRRTFIGNTAKASLALMIGSNHVPQNKIGIGLFSLPKSLETNARAALKMLADMGYKHLELYGPYPFSTEEQKKSWSEVTPMLGFSGSGFFGHTVNEFKLMMNDLGLSTPSIHTDLDTLDTKMGALAEASAILGNTYVTLPAIPPANRISLDDYKRTAELFNKIGAEAIAKGIKFAYHNHGYGFSPVNGQVPMDIIFKETDPKSVFFQMDLFWTTAAGADPVELLKRHKGRYRSMHVKDMKTRARFKGDGGDAPQWIELFPQMTTVGDGVLDLRDIITTAGKNGVEHFIVEQDMVAQPEIALKRSYDNLARL